MQQAEDDIAVTPCVGDDLLGDLPTVLAQHHIHRIQRIARSAGQNHRRQAGGLIVEHVQPGRPLLPPEIRRPLLPPEILRIRAGVMSAHRHHEPHAVHRGNQPAAPQPCEGNLGLGVDEHGIGRREGVRAQIVLVNVVQSVASQRLDSR